jgi:hypothetical protein
MHGISINVSADTTIDFILDGDRIMGRVVLGGNPVDRAQITIDGSTHGSYPLLSAHEVTDRDGRFLVYLPRGGYSIIVSPGPNYAFVTPRFFSRVVTEPQSVTLDLLGASWRGTIRDTDTGSPIASAKVVATDIGSPFVSAFSVSDSKGRFRLVLQPGSRYVLSVTSAKKKFVLGPLAPIRAVGDSIITLNARVAGS